MSSDGTAAGLVLLHGFTNTGASWAPVVAALGQRYKPIAPDIRGHGSGAARAPVMLGAVISDLEALPAERFTLAGYSQGGRIALHAALALPERVTRLVLIGASPGIADDTERAERRALDEQLAVELEAIDELDEVGAFDAFARRWAQTPVLAGVPEDVAAAAHADRLRNTPSGLAAALRGLGAGALPSLWDRLGELTVPVALIVGERDAKFRAVAAEMAALMPGARVEVVEGAGHAVHLEQPEAVAELIAPGHRQRLNGGSEG